MSRQEICQGPAIPRRRILTSIASAAAAAGPLSNATAGPPLSTLAIDLEAIRVTNAAHWEAVSLEIAREGQPGYDAAMAASAEALDRMDTLTDRLLSRGVSSWDDVIVRAKLLTCYDLEILDQSLTLDRAHQLTRELLTAVLRMAEAIDPAAS